MSALAAVLITSLGYSQTADSFIANANGAVYALAVQPDGGFLVGGNFTSISAARSRLARFNPDGTVDLGFTAGASNAVSTLAIQPDGKILVGGAFTRINGQTRNRLARLNSRGDLDGSFNPGASNDVNVIVLQPDGKILVGGSFLGLAGMPQRFLGRLNHDGTLDNSFTTFAGTGVAIFAMALQADGRIIVGGQFSLNVYGKTHTNLARLNADGTLDDDFTPSAGGSVYCLTLQADGKILVGGSFTTIDGQTRQRIARLNVDGSLDADFNPGADGDVNAVVLQADGKILVGGNFTTLGGETRLRIGRLNSDGTTDTFNPGANISVFALALQADGKILAGGLFSSLGGKTRNYLGRLNNNTTATQSLTSDGSMITWLRGGSSPEVNHVTFDQCMNGTEWIELGSAERIAGGWQLAGLALGANTTIRARGSANCGYRNGSGGYVEKGIGPPVFSTQPVDTLAYYGSYSSFCVSVVGDGPFTYQWYRNGVALANATNAWYAEYALDASANSSYQVLVSSPEGTINSAPATLWLPSAGTFRTADNSVYAMAVQADGKILVGGVFTNSPGNRIARINENGTKDTAFNPGVTNGGVFAIAVQLDGKILIGGTFTNLAGQNVNYLGRLNADGGLDTTFSPPFASGVLAYAIRCLAIRPDGRILVGGDFDDWKARETLHCLQLNSEGSLDTEFQSPRFPYPLQAVYALGAFSITILPGGKLLLCGEDFEYVSGFYRATYAERLNSDGSLDAQLISTFSLHPLYNNAISCASVQPEGGAWLGFRYYPGPTYPWQPPYPSLVHLDSSGLVDTNFTGSPNGLVFSLASQADGKVIVGGNFTLLGGRSCTNLGRLNPDGTLDTSFSFPSGYGYQVVGEDTVVRSLAIQSDGRVLVGGSFTNLGGKAQANLGRLNNSGPATQSINWNGSELSWLRGGTSPDVMRTHFEATTNGLDWTDLGEGERTPDGWQLSGVTMPADALIRARGFVDGNSSHWFVESLAPTSPPTSPTILASDGSFRFYSNRFGFNYSGAFGHLAVVEASTNFANWTPLETNRLYRSPVFFADPKSTNFSRRFYRTRLQ